MRGHGSCLEAWPAPIDAAGARKAAATPVFCAIRPDPAAAVRVRAALV